MSEEIEYVIKCSLCDVETSVIVLNDSETPAYCPMCGETTNPHQV